MGEFSLTHLLLVGLIALIFFGPSRLPALGQSLGKAIRGFKQGLNEIDAEVKPVREVNSTMAQLPGQPHQSSATGAMNDAVHSEKESLKT